MPIKAITFDFWSTLYQAKRLDYSERVLQLKALVERHSGVTFETEQFEAAVQLARDTWSQTWVEEYRTINANEWLSVILNELEISLNSAHLLEIEGRMEHSILDELPTLVADARSALPELSATYRLAIISDTGLTPGRVLRQLLERDGIIDHFSHLTFSDEVGCSKPHPDAFLTTLEALAAEPEEAVHVGDLLRTDIAGAQNVGMRAVQYVGINQGGESPFAAALKTEIAPDAIIESHTELKPLLQQWSYAESPATRAA